MESREKEEYVSRSLEKYYGELRQAAEKFVGEQYADDAVQETCVEAITYASRLNNSKPVRFWLKGILWNVCCRIRRKNSSEKQRIVQDEQLHHIVPGCGGEELEEFWRKTLRTKEAEYRLSVTKLTEREKEVFCLYVYNGMSTTEISAALTTPDRSISRSRVHAVLKNAIGRLLDCDMKEYTEEDFYNALHLFKECSDATVYYAPQTQGSKLASEKIRRLK